MTAAPGTRARNRRQDPVFRTASALILLVGIQELLAAFPMLPQAVGALRLPADSAGIAIRMLVEGLAVPVACVICGALMLLRGSVGAALLGVLVAFVKLFALGVSALNQVPVPLSIVIVCVLVVVAGTCATVRAAPLAGPAPPAERAVTKTRGRGPAHPTASAVVVLVGAVELIDRFPTSLGPELGAGGVAFAVWLIALYLSRPAAYVICGALMLLRRSVAAAVVAVLIAFLELLVLAPSLMGGFVPPVPVVFPLLVLMAGIWAVRREP